MKREPRPKLRGNPQFIEPNPDMLAIIRLYLEKRDSLNTSERELFQEIIASFIPPRIMLANPELKIDISRTENQR